MQVNYSRLMWEWTLWSADPVHTELMLDTAPELDQYSPYRSYLGPSWRPPKINGWNFLPWLMVKVVAWLVPDSLFGIRIAYAGFWHDRLYLIGGRLWDRMRADCLFIAIIWNKIRYADVWPHQQALAYIASPIFFIAVRLVGWTRFRYHKEI